MLSEDKNKIETAWEKLYAKDLLVIGDFLAYLKGSSDKTFRLFFSDGTKIIADFLSAGDSDNDLDPDDPYYEDLYELDFYVKKIEQKGTETDFAENHTITLNYHNFFVGFELYEENI